MSDTRSHGDSLSLPPWGLSSSEFDPTFEAAADDLQRFRGARLLLTGGTGFLGSWLLTHILRANDLLNLQMQVVVLSRRPSRFAFHELPNLEFVQGDVQSLPFLGQLDVIIHGATSSVRVGEEDTAANTIATIVGGTQEVLNAASGQGARLLFLSSGAVYGPQTAPVDEDSPSGPDPTDPRSSYAQSKRLAETLCAAATAGGDARAVIARLFAFVGPQIPLRAHFAVGNFLADRLEGKTITVRGDGSPYRSFLYTGDLPEWCWALLARGVPGRAYNVGSSENVTISELAARVASLIEPAVAVHTLTSTGSAPASWYVPSTTRAETELGLRPRVDLDEALRRTLRWYQGNLHSSIG